MIFQRRFHSHTPTTSTSPPTPPPKDGPSSSKTLEEVLAIAVSPRAPKPPPHALGTVASKPQIIKHAQFRSASDVQKSSVPRRAPSSRKIGHATIHTDAVGGHAAFESDAFAVHMPTTRVPIFDRPAPSSKLSSPTKAQVEEAVQTYKEKAAQARESNSSIGVRVPPKIASYDYACASTARTSTFVSPESMSPGSPPAPAGAFLVSPPVPQERWTRPEPKPAPALSRSKISSSTSISHKPIVSGITTTAAAIKESVQYVRADANGGASKPTSPPKSTKVKISMKPRVPAITVEAAPCQVDHCCGIYYRPPHAESIATSRSPSPTKTMPNFTRQYSLEGDSIFGYKVKDPLGTVAGANQSIDEEECKEASNSHLTPNRPIPKRTLTDRWPWIRKNTAIGKPPNAPAPDPPVVASPPKRVSVYISPFHSPSPPPHSSKSGPVPPTLLRPAAAVQSPSPKKAPLAPRNAPTSTPTSSISSTNFDTGFAQIQAFFLLIFKIGLALYAVVALWFILDAIREALCVVCVPFRLLGRVVGFVWAVISLAGRGLGGVVQVMSGRMRVLGR